MALTSEQLDRWRARNRATLFPGRLNRWSLIVSREVAANDADVERVARGLVQRLERNSASDFRLIRTSASRLSPPGIIQTRETVPQAPIPFATVGPVVWADVEFAWRSATDSVPWPAERFAGGLLPVDDPTDADVMLDSVGTSPGEAPAQRTPGERIVDEVTDAVGGNVGVAIGGTILGGIGVLWLLRKLGK